MFCCVLMIYKRIFTAVFLFVFLAAVYSNGQEERNSSGFIELLPFSIWHCFIQKRVRFSSLCGCPYLFYGSTVTFSHSHGHK